MPASSLVTYHVLAEGILEERGLYWPGVPLARLVLLLQLPRVVALVILISRLWTRVKYSNSQTAQAARLLRRAMGALARCTLFIPFALAGLPATRALATPGVTNSMACG